MLLKTESGFFLSLSNAVLRMARLEVSLIIPVLESVERPDLSKCYAVENKIRTKHTTSSVNASHRLHTLTHTRHLSLLLVLLTEVLGSRDHVGEGSLDLIPLTGLQAAVRVDPELLRAEELKHLLDALLELSLGGDTRAVDVIDTRADVAGVGLVNEDLEELGIRLRVLNREDIGVQGSDGWRTSVRIFS